MNVALNTDAADTHPRSDPVVRVATIGDVHCGRESGGKMQPLLRQMAESADVVVLCGDLTDHGLVDEAKVLAAELTAAVGKVPVLAVLGNHDYEADQHEGIRTVLADAGVRMMDGDAVDLLGVGFAGIKGFAGGFGRGTLSAFGERAMKMFVQEAIDEAVKLERALARLKSPSKLAILHYAPVRGTVEGEPPEIFPFLGCGRLEEPLNRYEVTACVHGHAHRGAPEGHTSAGIPVYNVAYPLMRTSYPDRPPFRILNLQATPTPSTAPHPAPTEAPVETPVR
jgi:Icc-related predicted phosphoesterase